MRKFAALLFALLIAAAGPALAQQSGGPWSSAAIGGLTYDSTAGSIAGTGITPSGTFPKQTLNLSAIASLDILANITGGSAAPIPNTFTAILDAALVCTAQGDVIYRGAATWTCLAPGASGTFLKSQGASANLIWATPAGSGNVTGPGSSTTNDCAKFADTSGTLLADAGVTCGGGTPSLTSAHIFVGNGSNVATDVALTGDATMANTGAITNTKVNGVSVPASPSTHQIAVVTASNTATYKTIPDCTDSAGSHLNYTQSTDVISCGTSVPSGTGNTGVATQWTKQLSGAAPVVLTDAATVVVDASLGNTFEITLGGNRAMGAPSNTVNGSTLIFYMIEDGTGSRIPTWNAVYKWPGGTAPTLSTAAGKMDMISCAVRSSNYNCALIGLDFH